MDAVPSVALEADADAVLASASVRAAVLISADAPGAAEKVLDMQGECNKQRNHFRVPIASFQVAEHAATTMLVAVESAKLIVYFAAASASGG